MSAPLTDERKLKLISYAHMIWLVECKCDCDGCKQLHKILSRIEDQREPEHEQTT